ncbi:hypothetical protein OIU35_04990 [Boseaceae bacterium BT-24-1]|nr:hypothetical protein [Boseaceae bacterium BT-24-1]
MDCNTSRGSAERKAEPTEARSQSFPEPNEVMVLGPAEVDACEYIAEFCEGVILVDGVSRLPKLGLQLMLLHALCLDYVAQARRKAAVAAA